MGLEKFTAGVIVVEAKLVREEAKRNGYVSAQTLVYMRQRCHEGDLRSRNVSESMESLALDELVHQVAAHVRSVEVQLEESVVIAESQR